MFLGNSHPPQNTNSPHAVKTDLHQVTPSSWTGRHMGPPQMNYPPQPVEIDPITYPRISGSYPPWEPTAYSIGTLGETNLPPSNSIGHNKPPPPSLDLGSRSSPQDPLTSWYTGNDGPWIPKGAVPEVPHDEKIQARGYATPRNPGYGSMPGPRHRPGNPSDNGSAPFGVSPSDSGYGTGSASVRGSDIMDQSQDNRSILGRIHENYQYNQGGSAGDFHAPGQWNYSSPIALLYQCSTCLRRVKTKSELKKHHLRHTKPFRCSHADCNRKEGFSTVNDLNRHKQSKHRGDFSGEIQAKTYHCLVPGCKSQEKIWPRLDNFRNHLKRMHRLSEDGMDEYVHRSDSDQQADSRLLSLESSSQSPSRLDHSVPSSLGPNSFREISYLDDHPHWSDVNPGSLDQQPERAESLLENTDAETMAPYGTDSLVGLEDDPGKTVSLNLGTALCKPDAGNGDADGAKGLTSADAAAGSISMPSIHPSDSPVDAVSSIHTINTGKIPEKSLPIDQCLWDAIIMAVISAATLGKETVSDAHQKSLPEFRSPDAAKDFMVPPCAKNFGVPLPNPVATTGKHPGDQDSLKAAPYAPASDKSHLADEEARVQKFLQIIKDAGYVLKKKTKAQAGPGQTPNNLGSATNKKRDLVQCPKCKFRGRPCELKKHMKRHTRPYGCTKCLKSFGSKNDWKRHETSQHFQHEMWKCAEKTNGASCAKVFFSADIARTHLTKVHKVTDPDTIQGIIDARRIGANNQAQFWCGFCEEIIGLTEKGVDAWTERFNHIDDHLMGKNGRTKQSIAVWKAADDDSEGAQADFSARPSSPKESDDLTSDNLSPPSNNASSTSADKTIVPPSRGAAQAQPKRKRADSDERGSRAKQARHGKLEIRRECCQCHWELNPRIDTACPSDGHILCDGCPEKHVVVQKDNGK